MSNFENPILKVRNLRKQFGDGCDFCRDLKTSKLEKNYCPKCKTVYACQDISFDVYEGEILGVVGESGSGKSTMMQSLYFDKDVTSGEVFIKQYENGEKNVLEESSQQKRYIKNNHF